MWIDIFRIDYINKNPFQMAEENIDILFNDIQIYRIIYDIEPTYGRKSDIHR
jgi:hypothetical protein